MSSLRLAITPGDPAGIGPDLVLQLSQHQPCHQWVVIADPQLLEDRARQLGLSCELIPYDASIPPLPSKPGRLHVAAIPCPAPVEAGRLNRTNASYVLATLDRALQGCLRGEFAALVTGPVHKGIINDAGMAFTGHTEYLAHGSSTARVVMMLANPTMRVALVTTHLPLRQVSNAITSELLTGVIRILHKDLRQHFALTRPRILVCGLNPHAGEDGHLGDEEIRVITPTLDKLREEGLELLGPVPADTAFTPVSLANADAVLAMYHDQGLPVLKHAGFGNAVNITLGLPFIRTSVDHGTALTLAGTGRASTGSLWQAIQQAEKMLTAEAGWT